LTARGVIRDADHAFSKDGGLAVLKGNLAEDGCIVKTAGVVTASVFSLVRRGSSRAKTEAFSALDWQGPKRRDCGNPL